MAYYYEVGYLASFNIPSVLAQFRLESLGNVSALTALLFFYIYSGIHVLYPFLNSSYIIKTFIRAMMIPITLIIFLVFIYPPLIMSYLHTLVIISVIYLVLFIGIPLWNLRKEKLTIIEKLKLDKQKEDEYMSKRPIPSIFTNISFLNVLIFCLFAFVAYIVAMAIGIRQGIQEKNFLSFNKNHTQYILVQDYGNEKIGVKITNNKLTNDFILVDDNENLTLKSISLHRSL